MTIKYMHTIKGKPAVFEGQLLYAGRQMSFFDLKDNLNEIRKEQIKSSEYRRKKGYDEHPQDYGYMRIKID